MIWIALVFGAFVLFLVVETVRDNSVTYKKWVKRRSMKKAKKFENRPLSDHHPYYWMWKKGDDIEVEIENNRVVGDLLTYSKTFAIVDINGNDVTVYGFQILQNPSHDMRVRNRKAEDFQNNILPEIRQNNLNDMKMLNSYRESNN